MGSSPYLTGETAHSIHNQGILTSTKILLVVSGHFEILQIFYQNQSKTFLYLLKKIIEYQLVILEYAVF